MNRRTLLQRFLTIVAAVAVSPAVKAEAAPSPNLTQAEIDALYVKAYGQEKVDSWAPLTFDAMAKDCAAQNHMLWSMDFEDGTRRVWHDDDTIGLIDYDDLAYVDAWRRSLHKSERS